MKYKKDDVVVITIEDMSENGEGIGKAEGYTLFVKDTVMGDQAEVKIIKAKKTYGYGKLIRLIVPSADRVEPVCPVAAPCGGCQLQAMSYACQLRFKARKVREHLERIGGFSDPAVLPVIGMEDPLHYRNKAQFPVSRGKDGKIRMGFYAGRTHAVIETPHCYIGQPVNDRILELVKKHMERYQIPPYDEAQHKGLVRHVLIRCVATTGQIMVCLVLNGSSLPAAEELVRTLRTVEGMTAVALNTNREKTNVILGKKTVTLYGPGYIVDQIGTLAFRISPQSFFQVNSVQTRVLYETALEYADLKGVETVWDLYCGTGTISLFLAQKARQVYGVEIIPQAIADARENARENGITNAEFFVGKAEEVLPELYRTQGIHADVIVVDPPRKGCAESLLDTIVQMQPEKLIYVSCNSATLARDLRYLCDRGFRVVKVQPVDMFPMTVGVETVCLLGKRKPDTTVKIGIDMEDYRRIRDEEKAE